MCFGLLLLWSKLPNSFPSTNVNQSGVFRVRYQGNAMIHVTVTVQPAMQLPTP